MKAKFGKVFWIVILMEFFERGSYYGLMSVLALYLGSTERGGVLGFEEHSVGILMGTITPLLYFLPIMSGALAERFGGRRTLVVAFTLLAIGYGASGFVTSYPAVFATLLVMALGAGTFKPIPSGTIARVTDASNSTLGFGIFYWTINLGAFVFPLVLVNWLKGIDWSYVFLLSAAGTGLMILPTLLAYREPPRPENRKTLAEVLAGALLVLRDWRFVLMIAVYSGFWILYFQMFHTVLWYLKDHVDMAPVEAAVNGALAVAGLGTRFVFDVEHVTVLNAGTIILLQLLVSRVVASSPALPTMIAGIAIGTCGMGLLALSSHAWVFIVGVVIFSIGEMTTHPKFISYVGLIAPKDKVALYMGYMFLYGVIGSSVGGLIGGYGYEHFVKELQQPRLLWLLFCGIGVATIVGLAAFHFLVAKRRTSPPA
ncbi:MAG: MFS transporter [Deltaproteobacteria bacterium]|nr:MFS transporter [Deltaproteobacteria bacterium]